MPELFPENVHTVFWEVYSRARREQAFLTVEDYYAPLDTWFDIRVLPQGEYLYLHFRDVTAQKRAEREVREAQERLREAQTRLEAALSAGAIATWTFDIVHDSVVADENLARLFSVDKRSAEGGGLDAYLRAIHPDDLPRVSAAIADALREGSGDRFESEYRVVLPDGAVCWLAARGRVERDADGRAVSLPGVVLDITARKQAEAALREEGERFQAVARATRDAVWDWDIATGSLWWNEGVTHLFGYGADEVRGDVAWWKEHVHPDDHDRVTGGVAAVVAGTQGGGFSWQDEYRFLKADGTWADVLDRGYVVRDAAGSPLHMVGAMLDQTERKRLERELRASEARFRVQADAMPQMVWATDPRGNHLYFNRRWYEYTGQTVEESLGFGFALALHPDDVERTLERWRRAWEGGADYEIEYRFRRHDGVYRWFVGRAEPVRDPETGVVRMWAGTCTDIDELKRAQDGVRVSEERYRALVDASSQIVWTNSPEGRMEGEQPGWAAFTGQTPEEYRGYGWADAVHPEDRAAAVDEWNRAVRERRPYLFEQRVRRKDGVYRTFSIRGVPVVNGAGEIREWVGVHTDITERREAEARERFLADLTARTRALLDPDAVLWETVSAVGVFLGASRCAYVEVDQEAGRLTIHRDWTREGQPSAAGDYPLAGFGPDTADELRAGRNLIVTDTAADDRIREENRATYAAMGIRSLANVPFLRDGRWVGTFIVNDDAPRDWTPEEVGLLEAVAERTRLALENARLYRAQQEYAAKNERIAETLQRSMLVTPDARRYPGVELGTDYEAAWDEAEVGGDFFDTFALPGGRVALVVGDATGKGLEAAAHTAEVKYALRAYLRESPDDPAGALGRLNRLLVDKEELANGGEDAGQSCVALAVAVLDGRTGEGVCASAGAEPPLLVRCGTGAAEEVWAHAALLGAAPETVYAAAGFRLSPGDLLVLTTDGVTESRSPADRRRFFGCEGVAEVARESVLGGGVLPPADLAKRVTARAKAFGGGKLRDDVCVLVARRLCGPAGVPAGHTG
jgi:PAS domain S-box-containing protein